jgi:hypothetical protein
MIPDAIIALFSNLPGQMRSVRLAKTQFSNINEIPDCNKYSYPNKFNIGFEVPPGLNHESVYKVARMSVEKIFHISPFDFLDLHPVRYDRVKEDLSNGFCYMPWMSYKADNQREYATIQDGRHRIVALLKLGIADAQVVYPNSHEYLYTDFFVH